MSAQEGSAGDTDPHPPTLHSPAVGTDIMTCQDLPGHFPCGPENTRRLGWGLSILGGELNE